MSNFFFWNSILNHFQQTMIDSDAMPCCHWPTSGRQAWALPTPFPAMQYVLCVSFAVVFSHGISILLLCLTYVCRSPIHVSRRMSLLVSKCWSCCCAVCRAACIIVRRRSNALLTAGCTMCPHGTSSIFQISNTFFNYYLIFVENIINFVY